MQWLSWVGVRDIDWADDGPVYHGPAACLRGAVAGVGVALADELVGGDLVLSGQLVKPLGEARESDYTLTLLCRKDALNGAEAAAFINWLRPAIDAYRGATRFLVQQSPYVPKARPRARPVK